jgi:hypothetical protein
MASRSCEREVVDDSEYGVQYNRIVFDSGTVNSPKSMLKRVVMCESLHQTIDNFIFSMSDC